MPFSKSDLARRHGMTQRAISVEVDALERAGLVQVEVVGSAHLVRAQDANPAASHLRSLLRRDPAVSPLPGQRRPARSALVALGAPLPAEASPPPLDRERALVEGLEAAREDAEVLRVLPAVVARCADRLEWSRVLELARASRLKAELGLVLEVAAAIAPLPWLCDLAAPLRDGRRRVLRPLPDGAGEVELALARRHAGGIAERWGFCINLRHEDFRAALAQSLAPDGPGLAPDALRAAIEEALRALDGSGTAPAELTLLGDAALVLRHGRAPAFPRLEAHPSLSPEAARALGGILARHPWLAPPPAGDEPPAPLHWRDRRTSIAVAGTPHMRLFVPEAHDWAVLLAARALSTDLASIEAHHRREPLRLLVLVSRYLEAVGGSPEAEARLLPGFLAVVERLFGGAALRRVRACIPLEATSPGAFKVPGSTPGDDAAAAKGAVPGEPGPGPLGRR